MSQTILVTGSSGGLGRAVVEHFALKGWNVAATMRDVSKGTIFEDLPNVEVIALDVSDAATIPTAVEKTVATFKTIDVLFNNVGYGGLTAFEECSDESFRKAFETNFFGHLNVMRSVLPVLRAQKSGFIINVSSLAGLFGIPLQTAYCASKFAMTGFTETVKWELKDIGIETTVLEVGGMKTDFASNMVNGREIPISDYDAYMDKMIPMITAATEKFEKNATSVDKVATQVYRLVHMKKKPFRYHPTKDGKFLVAMKWFLTDGLFRKLSTMGLD